MRAAGIARPGLAALSGRVEVFKQLDMMPTPSKAQQGRFHNAAGQADDPAKVIITNFAGEHDFEPEKIAEKRQRPVQVGHGKTGMMGAGDGFHYPFAPLNHHFSMRETS